MRAAIVAASMHEGGAERVALNLAREFLNTGHGVDLVLVSAEGELLSQVPVGVQVVDLAAPRARAAILGLRRYVSARRPDALLAINYEVNLTAALATIGMKVGPLLVLSVHMPIAPWLTSFSARKKRVVGAVCRAAYARAERTVAVSQGIASDLLKLGWATTRQVAIINNPVLPNELEELVSKDIGHPWLDDAEIPCIVTVGRLTPLKNQALLIEAFERMGSSHPAHLIFVGDGECRQALEQLASRSEVRHKIDFIGHVANPYPILKSANLFVLSSDYEGFGNVLVEAMAVGTPVVATDCDYGPREILEDGRWGRLVPCRDSAALASAMLAGLADARGLALERARQYNVSAKAAEYLRLIQQVLEERGA